MTRRRKMSNKVIGTIKNIIHPHKKPWDYAYSLYINIKCFPFSTAIKMPLLVRFGTKIRNCHRGSFVLTEGIEKGTIRIGFPGAAPANKTNTFIDFGNNSKIFLGDNNVIAMGVKIILFDNAEVHIGTNTYLNSNTSLQCEERIDIGRDVFVGWDVRIRDTDGHTIYENGIKKPKVKPVIVEDKAWLTSNVTLLKGTYITTGSIVACNSLVCGLKMDEPNCLVAGSPGKVIKHNITWEE